jgi:nitrite reductase (NO-forming)
VIVVVVREQGWPTWALGGAAAVYGAGLVVLMVLLQTTVRRGVQRRFDVAVRWYLTALAFGLVGTLAAVARAWGADVSGDLRGTHLVLNVLGLVGLVIAGTLPSFLATEARVKMSPRATPARLTGLLAWQASAVAVAAAALTIDQRELAAVGLGAYVAGLAGLSSSLPGFGMKQLRWAGPRLVQLVAGLGWWAGTVVQAAVVSGRGDVPFLGTTVLVLVVAGYGQILWASLAYLLPVLRGGGHERLAAGFATTRSWVALLAANAAGVALVAGASAAATVLVAVWIVDSVVRVVRLTR